MTTYAYASSSFVPNEKSRREVTVTAASTVEGDKVVWVTGTAGYHITVARWSASRAGEYVDVNNPLIVIKNTADCSGGATDTLVKSEDGTTLYTFDGNNSSTPGYVALRLVTGTMEVASWRVA